MVYWVLAIYKMEARQAGRVLVVSFSGASWIEVGDMLCVRSTDGAGVPRPADSGCQPVYAVVAEGAAGP